MIMNGMDANYVKAVSTVSHMVMNTAVLVSGIGRNITASLPESRKVLRSKFVLLFFWNSSHMCVCMYTHIYRDISLCSNSHNLPLHV